MNLLMKCQYSFGLFSEEQGYGKTTLIKQLLTNETNIRLISNGSYRNNLKRNLFIDHFSIIHQNKNNEKKKYFIWIDDININDCELIRSWIDQYSSTKQDELCFIITGDKAILKFKRFSHHFVPIFINETINNLISSIYSIPIRDWLEEFSVDSINHPIELANGILLTIEETIQFLRNQFLKFHWNLHHVESIVNGLFLLDGKMKRAHLNHLNSINNFRFSKKKQQEEQTATIIRLLIHEISRTILDRLTNDQGFSFLFFNSFL